MDDGTTRSGDEVSLPSLPHSLCGGGGRLLCWFFCVNAFVFVGDSVIESSYPMWIDVDVSSFEEVVDTCASYAWPLFVLQ